MTKSSYLVAVNKKFTATCAAALSPWAEIVYRHYRSTKPQHRVGNLIIVGNDLFAAIVVNAVKLLELHDRNGYSLVQRFVRAIVEKKKEQELGYVIGVQFEVANSSGEPAWDTKRIAACLVRTAVHTRLFRHHHVCLWFSRPQLVALRRELRSMKLLGCNPAHIDEQREFIRFRGGPVYD